METNLLGMVPGIIDAHLHQWDPLATPREASSVARVYRLAPKVMERLAPYLIDKGSLDFMITPRHVLQPYLSSHFKKDSDETIAAVGVPVDGFVHVEAGWHSSDPTQETQWLESLVLDQVNTPKMFAIVGHADPCAANFAQVLDAHKKASNRFKGIRYLTSWHKDKKVKRWAPHEGVMTSPKFLNGFEALANRNLTFDAYVYSAQLKEVFTLAKTYPETTIVLDHYASPVGSLGPMGSDTGKTKAEREIIFDKWRDDLALLAECANVISKQSIFPAMLGIKQQGIGRAALAELVAPMVEHAAQVFGRKRMMFGGNYPVDKPIVPYGTAVGVLADILAQYGEGMLSSVFRETAINVYGLDVKNTQIAGALR